MNARGNALLLEEKERKFVNKQLPKVEEELHLLIRGRSPNWFWSLSVPHKPLKPNHNQFKSYYLRCIFGDLKHT